MRRLLAAVAALCFLLVPAAASAAAQQAGGQAHAAVQAVQQPAGVPAQVDAVTCAEALIPVWGLVSGSSTDCLLDLTEAGVGVATDVASEAFEGFFGAWVDALTSFVSDLIYSGFTWWLMPDGVRISNLGIFGAEGTGVNLPAICLGLGVFIATMLTIFQGLRTIVRRKGTPLVQALQGLMLHVLAVALGVAVIDGLLEAADALTEAILAAGFQASEDAPEQIVATLLPQIGNPVGLACIALIVLLIGLVQLVLLFLRQAALPVLALLLPIASSGQVGEGATRQWLPRLITMMFAIIAYKPMAALIITVGFVEMSEAPTLLDWIRGVVTLALSVVALPAMMKLFAPLGAAGGNAVASGGGLVGAAAGVAGMVAARSGGGGDGGSGPTSVTQHAGYMAQHGPAQQGPHGGEGGPREGDAAVRHSSGQVPDQPGPREAGQDSGSGGRAASGGAGSQESGASVSAGSSGAAGGSGASAGGGAGAAAGGVQVAVVAAEAGKAAADKGAQTMSGDGQ